MFTEDEKSSADAALDAAIKERTIAQAKVDAARALVTRINRAGVKPIVLTPEARGSAAYDAFVKQQALSSAGDDAHEAAMAGKLSPDEEVAHWNQVLRGQK